MTAFRQPSFSMPPSAKRSRTGDTKLGGVQTGGCSSMEAQPTRQCWVGPIAVD